MTSPPVVQVPQVPQVQYAQNPLPTSSLPISAVDKLEEDFKEPRKLFVKDDDAGRLVILNY